MNNVVKKLITGEYNRLFDTIRWNSSNFVFQKESLASHQFTVAVLANALACDLSMDPTVRLQVLEYALHHDWDEIYTGDIGHEVKYNRHNGQTVREVLDSLIQHFAEKEFLSGEEDSQIIIGRVISGTHDYKKSVQYLVKVCDWLSMLFFCIRETKLGNSYFKDTMHYCAESCILSIEKFWNQYLVDCETDADFCTLFVPDEEYKNDLIDFIKVATIQTPVAILDIGKI